MPKLTDTMEEGVVVKWKKREGDQVGAGDVLAEIETDKAVMDLEAFASGTLKRILAAEGETVKAGSLIAVIAEPDEDIESVLKGTMHEVHDKPSAAAAPAPPQAGAQPAKQAAAGEPEPHPKASPRARKLAAERGIDLSSLQGTGPEGRITEQDVLKAPAAGKEPAAGKAAPPDQAAAAVEGAAGTDRPLSQMRKAIARTMTQSKAPVPHFYLTTEIAMDETERLRAQLKQDRREQGVVPNLTDMIIKAAALALTRHPEINVSYAGDKLRQHATIDIGIAVGLEDGLISPVLRDCGRRTLDDISTEGRVLIERARNRRLQPEEYTGATFTISNLGMFDVENFIAVLIPPEAAAIAVGTVRDVPVVEAGGVKIGRRMKVTLSCDHRALDGMQGAKFLREFKRVLEHPQELTKPVVQEKSR
jgi:pyruvate dehydrogenase E2 component (dihydrolipoamide acetyltransferase)